MDADTLCKLFWGLRNMKKILIIATGGTIASKDSGEGLAPQLNVDDLINYVPNIKNKCELAGKMIMNIDSSNMTPSDWQIISKSVYDNYRDYDGFVITHGTDTMAYTSSALTYMLKNLDKPVIVTGSQYSIAEDFTDAMQNLHDSVLFALEDIKGVFIAFDGKLIVGTRAMKVKTRSYDAFESVNYPYVAEIKHSKINYNNYIKHHFLSTNNHNRLELLDKVCNDIQVVKLFPGMDASIFDYLASKYKGLIIESFGIGGIPFGVYDVSTKLRELADRGIAIAVTTQCLQEGIEFGVYEVGKKIPKEKLIYANDMNFEALVAKLMCALGRYENLTEVKAFIEKTINFDMN